jgi:hypothetical protein
MYRVSHGELLIRSPKDFKQTKNCDLTFVDVQYVDLPRYLDDLEVGEPDEADLARARERLPKRGLDENVFVLISSGRRYLVVAAQMEIAESEMDIFEHPFE